MRKFVNEIFEAVLWNFLFNLFIHISFFIAGKMICSHFFPVLSISIWCIDFCKSNIIAERYSVTEVAESRLSQTSLTSDVVTVTHHLRCINCYIAAVCDKISWCNLFCLRSGRTYELSNLVAMPHRVETETGPVLSCWSKRIIRDLITESLGAVTVASATVTASDYPRRTPDQLLDSVYDWDVKSCFCSENDAKPFISFDLQTEKTVNKVMLLAQPTGAFAAFFRYFETITHSILPGIGQFDKI